MDKQIIKKIPYGISDYALIRASGYYYVDKSPYIERLENAGRYLFFIRPRRFGKSLFIGLLQAYYDIVYKDRFEEFFKGTWIFDHLTGEQSKYLMLTFNFAEIDPNSITLENSFLDYVKTQAVTFIQKYRQLLSGNAKIDFYEKIINESVSGAGVLSSLFNLCRMSTHKLYVIVDEYDNFTNAILSTTGEDAYQKLTHGDGFFKSFFNAIKAGTTATEAPVARTFISGVSPVTMDDVTSGYNIGSFISLNSDFNEALGFTRKDVSAMLNYYKSAGMIVHEPEALISIMEEWYGNYLFSEYTDLKCRLYNSDMVLFFLNEYLQNRLIPKDLIDRNVRIDYGKLRHLIILDRGDVKTTNGNFSQLKMILEEGGMAANLVDGFPLEKITDKNNFISLLFYFGLLTIDHPQEDKLRLIIPNETVRRLFYNYIEEAYRETGVFSLNLSEYANLMSGMAYRGLWKPLFELITQKMRESISLRDLITGEKSIQAFLNVYLGLSDLYIIHTEKEMNKGFSDIVMEPFIARYDGIKYSYILEIKYIKVEDKRKGKKSGAKVSQSVINSARDEALSQLNRYSIDEKFRKSSESTTLKKLLLIFVGTDLVHIEEVV